MYLTFSDIDNRLVYSSAHKPEITSNLKGNNILEIGCGSGSLLFEAYKANPTKNFHAVECDAKLYALAKERVPTANIIMSDFIAMQIPLSWKGLFDTIILSSTAHEIQKDYGPSAIQLLFQRISLVLRNGGTLLFRDGVKPNKRRNISFRFKTEIIVDKLKMFRDEFRATPILPHSTSDTHIHIDNYNAHDFLTKFYYEGDLWKKDMQESFGVYSAREIFDIIQIYFDVIEMRLFTPITYSIYGKRI